MTAIAQVRKWTQTRRGLRLALLCGTLGFCLLVRAGLVQAQNLSGSGSWRSSVTDDKEGTWQLTATKSDSGLSGSLTATGTSDFAQGSIFGAVGDNGDIHFGIVYDNSEQAVFTGTVTGAVASGTYTTSHGDSGTWTGGVGPQQ